MKRSRYMTDRLCVLLIGCSLFVSLLASCVKLPHRASLSASQFGTLAPSGSRINLNTASAEELEKLPGIGRALAARIVSHRERYGRFRRAEHLLMVRGIGERRFLRLRPFITVE